MKPSENSAGASRTRVAKKSFKPNKAHANLLIEIGKVSASKSIKENQLLGLPTTYLEGNDIVKEHADGTKEIIGHIHV